MIYALLCYYTIILFANFEAEQCSSQFHLTKNIHTIVMIIKKMSFCFV